MSLQLRKTGLLIFGNFYKTFLSVICPFAQNVTYGSHTWLTLIVVGYYILVWKLFQLTVCSKNVTRCYSATYAYTHDMQATWKQRSCGWRITNVFKRYSSRSFGVQLLNWNRELSFQRLLLWSLNVRYSESENCLYFEIRLLNNFHTRNWTYLVTVPPRDSVRSCNNISKTRF